VPLFLDDDFFNRLLWVIEDDLWPPFGFNAAIDSDGVDIFVESLVTFAGLSTPVDTGLFNVFWDRVFFIFFSFR
jgi:hypothetical protein